MLSLEDLMQQCIAQNTDAQNRAALQAALQKLQSQTTDTPMDISPDFAKQIEQAAAAAQTGDKGKALSMMQKMLSTPEGAALAEKLKSLLR